MEVDCEGCAGCCVDWRALCDPSDDQEHDGSRPPLDDVFNLVPLTREDVRAFAEAGYGDALTPRLWTTADREEAVTVDGRDLAAVDGKPVFFLGLRKPPKPVAPFGTDPRWLPTCAFLDPATLQCRIHDADVYPEECADYPGHNLALGAETECERVEAAFGGRRLLDDAPPEDVDAPLLGPQAIGEKVFCYPDPADLAGVVDRLVADDLSRADRAAFVGVAAAGSPGTTEVAPAVRERYEALARAADSWAGRSVTDWEARTAAAPDPALAATVEEARGAPPTPGWDA